MPDRKISVRGDLALEELRRDVRPRVHEVPAAELDLAELVVLVRVPVDIPFPVQLLVAPPDELEIVLRWVVAHPVDVLVALDPRLPLRAPELRRPGVDPEVVVQPVVRAALDRLLRVVLEVVEDRDRGISGQLGRLLAEQLVCPQVVRRVVLVRVARVRPEVDAAERVVGEVRGDVRPVDDRLHHRPDLGLGRRVRARAMLLGLDCPFHREVAVQVEPLERRCDLDRDAVEVPNPAFPEQPEVLAALLVRVAPDHEPRLLRMRLPRAVRIADPHHQDAPVAVEILLVEPVELLREGPGPSAGADEPGPVGQCQLGAVGVQPRDDVEDACVEGARHPLVASVPREQAVHHVERRRGAGHLDRVDVGLDQQRRLFECRPGLGVRDRGEPDVPALVALADRLDGEELGPLAGPALEELR